MGMMSSSSITSSRAPTFFITDPRMLAHKSEWDPLHIDTPERLKTILELFEKEKLISQCELLESVECSIEDLNLVHSLDHINGIQRASALPDFEQMEALCKGLEDIYVNKYTWDCARLSAGCAVRAVEAVLASGRPDANAFAAIRPPGHHASQKGPCGFCIFNNVAICAKKARSLGVERVLIIDWDVHAAQGTQYCVEGEPGILLISAQRYERGQFWPELPEIGHSHQYRNTINVPLDEIGYGDAEYAAFMHSLVLPLIRQWQPGLILISCGFDAALGDPAGEMEVTPAGFAYMTGLLAQQGIPLVLLLEGGYFLDSVVQGAHFCMRALLKRAPPVQNFCQQRPSTKFLRTIYSILLENAHQFPLFHEFIEKLNSLRFDLGSAPDRRKKRQLSPIRILRNEYLGNRKTLQLAMDTQMYPTRGEYSPRAKAITRQFSLRVRQLVEQYAISPMMIERVCIELELGPGGKIFIPKPATNGTSNGWRDVAFRFTSANQFLLFYFYILLPLDFTYFDVQLGGHKLPLNAGQLDEFVDKFQQKQLAMNGHLENGGAGGKEAVTAAELENILDIFAQLKLFFLF